MPNCYKVLMLNKTTYEQYMSYIRYGYRHKQMCRV